MYSFRYIILPTYNHCWKCYTSGKTDSNWSSYQSSKLPQNLFLSWPRLFSPKSAARRTASRIKEYVIEISTFKSKIFTIERTIPKIMKITDFFHTKPTEFCAAKRTRHMIATSIIHFDDQNLTSRTWFYVISWIN